MAKKIYFLFLVLISISFLSNLVSAQDQKSISAEVFGSLPQIQSVRISPDGTKILMLKSVNGRMVLITKVLNSDNNVENIIPPMKGEYNWAEWVSDDHILASIRFVGHEDRSNILKPSLQRRLVSMDWQGKKQINPLKFRFKKNDPYKIAVTQPQLQDRIIDILKDDPDHILIQLDIDTPGRPAVYRLNIKTRKRVKILRSHRKIDWWMTDQSHVVRYGEGKTTIKGRDKVSHIAQYRKAKGSNWIKLFDYDELTDRRPFYFEGFTDNPDIVYITTEDENNRRSLFTYNVDQKKIIQKVAGSPDYDIFDVSFNEQKELDYYSYYDEKPFFVRFNSLGKSLNVFFEREFPGDIATVESKTEDEKTVIFRISSPKEQSAFYLLDVNSEEYFLIGRNYEKLDRNKLSEMDPISYQARDGLKISGYLSLPKGNQKQNFPTVIMPHGGPMSGDGWGFDYWVQFLTTRGFAVLQMNYRGSTGYGEDFRMMGYHEWGRKMLEDINDGTKWMIDQGYANPEKICIMGGSYGGYAALQTTVKAPGLYKCSVAFAPVTDIAALMFHVRDATSYKSYYNYVESDEWTFDEASPIHNVADMNQPVLLVHGTKDMNSRIGQSSSFYKAMKSANKNINYIELEDGDHFLSKQEHRIKFLSEVEKFLDYHLKE